MDNESVRVFSWDEVVRAIFLTHGIKSGLWRVGVGLKFAATSLGESSAGVLPAGVVLVETVALEPVSEMGALVFDAAQVNRGNPKVRLRTSEKRLPQRRTPAAR